MSTIKRYACTFCGYLAPLTHFLIKIRSGTYSRKQFKCPDCENTMYRDTLITRMSTQFWGAWISANMRLYGHKFNERIRWEKLKTRLVRYGIANDFWKGFYFVKDNWDKFTDKQVQELSTLKGKPETEQKKLGEYSHG